MEARVFRVNYGSLGASRNFGVDQCSGEYVCVADADDLISSNCLTQMYKTIKKYNIIECVKIINIKKKIDVKKYREIL